MGCAQFLCPRLSLSGGERYSNANFLVCVYDPQFYSSESGSLFTTSPTGCTGRDAKCADALCVKFQSGGDESKLAETRSIDVAQSDGFYCGELSYRIT